MYLIPIFDIILMNWVRSIFSNVDFTCTGAFVKLGDPEDNYCKKTEFLTATLVLKKNEIFLRNNDFDPEQDQIEFISFPLSDEIQLTHFVVLDEERRVECVKWVNLAAKGKFDRFFGFEFEDLAGFTAFQAHAIKFVKIDEEGLQSPEHKKKKINQKGLEALKVTTHVPASNISKVQVKPETDESEDPSTKVSIQFKREAITYLSHLYTPDQILFMASADLYLLGPNLPTPLLTDEAIGFLLIKHSNFQVSLDLVRNQNFFMRIPVDSQFYCYVDADGQKFSWIEVVQDGENRTWRVSLNENLEGLEALINVARYESEHKVMVSELEEDDQAWIKGVEKLQINEKQEKIVVEFPEAKKCEEVKAEVEVEVEEIYDSAAGWRTKRVFAGHKGKITIFDDQEGEGLRRIASFEVSKEPVKILLQQQDTHLICLSNDLPNIVTDIDTERGTPVTEFSLRDKTFLQLSHASKLSPLTDSPLFIGLAYNGVYLLDPRSQVPIVQEFQYQNSPAFSCISTTSSGHLALGTETGEVKLYSTIGKKAVTTFPNLGSPIKSIDTTKCGSFILATTNEYLLLLKAEYEGELAYTKPLAKKRKPAKRLTLTPEDQAKYGLGELDFTPARFNVSEDSGETMIITSTGNLLIVWNFLSVKTGKLFDYFIKPLGQRIVRAEFRFNEENAIVRFSDGVVSQPSRWSSV